MALAAFDTLEFVEELEKAGIPEKQARAISIAVRKAYESSDVATKGDISELRHEISDLRKEIKESSLRTIIWLGSIGFILVNAGPILPRLLNLS